MAFVFTLTWLGALYGLALYLFGYAVILTVYRLWFSPLAAFPGPLLARTSFWYEFYYNWIRLGTYYLKVKEMHDMYGSIVRVTPDEVHVAEPSFYHTLFVPAAVRKTNNYPRFSFGTGFEDMTAISTSHNDHRRSRAPLEPFFSRAGITRVESRVVERVKTLYDRLKATQNTGEVVHLTFALSSLTTDVISSIIFEEPSDYLGDPDFNARWFETLSKGTRTVPLFAQLPWLTRCLAMPLVRSLTERVTRWSVWDDKARRQILKTKLRPSDEAKTREDTTVLDHLVHSDLTEGHFRKGGFARLAQLIQQAGAHNVSHTLGTILTYLLLDKDRLSILQMELGSLFEEHQESLPSWRDLEKAPYLAAVIKEGLRMAIGGMNRTPRVFPDDDIQFHEWTIPKGTPISMSSYWMHMDPDIFPSPEKFHPERWFAEPDTLKRMQSYFVPFSRGSRNCVGQNLPDSLVYMQMFHTLAHLLRPGAPEIVLYETDTTDVIAVHGLLFPMPRLDSKGIRVIIR